MNSENYFKVGYSLDNQRGDPIICIEHDLSGVDPEVRFDDKPIRSWSPEITFLTKGTVFQDYPACPTGWKLFSNRLKNLVERNGIAGVSFYPIRVVSEKASSIGTYWYAHFVTVKKAIDMENSTYDYMSVDELPQPVFVMIRPVLKRQEVGTLDIFRLGECPEVSICNERFRDLILENSCSGFNFMNIRLT